MRDRLCVVMQHHLNVVGPHIAKVHCPSVEVPIVNSASDAVERALSKPALGELVRGVG